MGVLYGIYGLDDWLRSALDQYDVQHAGLPGGRNPTISEVRAVLDHLAGFRVAYEGPHGRSWSATVEDAERPEEGPWTQLRTLEYASENEPIKIYFEKGWPDLVVRIVHGLAQRCGSLGIVPDTGEQPLLVLAGADPEALLQSWEHTRPAGTEEEQ